MQGEKKVKMTFFGLAKLCGHRRVKTFDISYLSPKLKENFDGNIAEKFNTKDDVYALGVTLGKLMLKVNDE